MPPRQLDKVEILTQPPVAETQANEEGQGNLLQEYEQRLEKLSEDQKFSKLCSESGLRLVDIGHFFHALPLPRKKKINLYAENIHCLEIRKELKQNGGSKAMYDLALSQT